MDIQERLQNIVTKATEKLGLPAREVSFEHPTDLQFGDYSTNVALVMAKEAGMNPRELAEKIQSEVEKDMPEGIEKIEIAGPGFINFYLTPAFFTVSIDDIIEKETSFGKSTVGENKKVLVEYSSPNIAKPFTVGHLRSTIIGDSVALLLESLGYVVVRDNHLGDWGTQFGKLIVALKKWGDLSSIQNSSEPIKDLVDLYVRFHDEAEKDPTLEDEARAWFTKLEQKDEEATAIWKTCIDLSMKEFNRIYDRLGIKEFDTLHGESFFENKLAEVLEDVKEKSLGKESEGAFLIFFDEEKKLPPLMLTKKDGSSLYALRDLATDKWRKDTYGSNLTIVNEVGKEQEGYFKQIFEAEELLGYFPKEQRVHVAHGHYRFKEGKMSTRKGNVIWLDDILNEAEKRAGEINKDSAKEVALAAIKWNDLKRESTRDIVFDWDEMLSLQGDTGPYVQYTAVRAASVVGKAKEAGILETSTVPSSATEIERLLYRFPEVVERAGKEYAPHYVATYLIEVARAFNAFYGTTKIIDADDPLSSYKVKISQATGVVLRNGLTLLGIPVPEKM